jgi:hypothetical protein
MPLNIATTRDRLQKFEFARLFIDELGWSNPKPRNPIKAKVKETPYTRTPIAQLAGVVVFEVTTGNGIPDAKARAAIQKHVAEEHVENLLIFLDPARTQSLWYWVKRESGKAHARDHLYVKGQPGDLFLSKLAAMVVDISELDAEGNIPVTEVAGRLKAALDVERVTKKFYGEFDTQRLAFVEHIQGINDDHQRRWYASVLMNRLMFIWFLQRKGFLDGADRDYLTNKLAASKKRGADNFYSVFLKSLFFEGFAQPEPARSPETRALLGKIRYLNGGLFLPHRVELRHGFPDKQRIKIPDVAFENIFALFSRYSWNLNDTPGGDDQEINPDVLGYIFEKYINQKEFGAYYTRHEMTGYLCERAIYKLVLNRVNKALNRRFATISDLLLNLDANLCRVLLFEILPSLRLLDPACGSGAFLVAAMKVLIAIYSAVIGKIQFLNDAELARWHEQTQAEHPSVLYFIKKQIITNNLFGVDIMEEGTEIARLRLFLALVASAQTEDQLEPLPNIDFNILAGNSLIGLLRVDPTKFDAGQAKNGGSQERMTLQHGSDLGFTVETKTAPTRAEKTTAFVVQQNAARFAAILEDKNKSIELYRIHAFQPGEKDGLTQEERLIALRSHIENVREQSYARLNQMLLDEFNALGIQFEQATWDDKKNDTGKPEKRRLRMSDIEALHPFHWGYEFDKVMADGGFDGIITNPPWETFKPQSKEFFDDYSDLVSKNKMTIKDFEKEQAKLLKISEIRDAWLAFLCRFPHVSAYFRSAAQFKNQIAIVKGKKAGTDINLYKLFLEQSFRLLRADGQCGVIIPGSITNDLGAKQLREMLFTETRLDSLVLLSNERYLFEGVHHDQQFCLILFTKGGKTETFAAAFRIDVREAVSPERLDSFLHSQSELLEIPVELVRRLAPDSYSIMDFKCQRDLQIADTMVKHPLLGAEISGKWSLELSNEFHMTGDSDLYLSTSGHNRLPLFEGKLIHQFTSGWGKPKYWLDEKKAAARLLNSRVRELRKLAKKEEAEFDETATIKLDYTQYRLAFRDVGPATNERSVIATVLPPKVFCPHTMSLEKVFHGIVLNGKVHPNHQTVATVERLFVCALMNSFVIDAWLRKSITKHVSFFYVYATPIPRLTLADAAFAPIVQRATQLICTAPEFDALAKEASTALKLPPAAVKGVTDAAARGRLRAELDGLIAHLYGLTESEFIHILSTFPLVAEGVKTATLAAFRELAPDPEEHTLRALIAAGETNTVEFKEAAAWNHFKKAKEESLRKHVAEAAAAFLNAAGGVLLIGVKDDGTILGVEEDMAAADPSKPNRDGYELFLRNFITGKLGADATHACQVTFPTTGDKTICRIAIPASPKPVFLDGDLIIRAGNQSKRLNAKEAIAYQKEHWPA